MTDKINTVILAAGKGTRLKSKTPKPLMDIGGKALIEYVLEACTPHGDVSVIVGHEKERVQSALESHGKSVKLEFLEQKEQLGTGDAIKTYFLESKRAKQYKYTVVMCADTPLISKEIISSLIHSIDGHQAVVASFSTVNPFGLGRIQRHSKGLSIIEEKDASNSQREIQEVNSGLYIFETQFLSDQIQGLNNQNASGEFYLTDVFKEHAKVKAMHFDNSESFIGINDLLQLEEVDRFMRAQIKQELVSKGVRLLDPSHTYIYTTKIAQGTVIYPNVFIDAHSEIGEDCVIEAGVFLRQTTVGARVNLKANSYLTQAKVASECSIGPMAHIRPGSVLGEKVKLGNFVEVKKSTINASSSVSHLSYLGDAEVGSGVNIGCGFITCNFDGANKHKTIIGDNSFIGSDCQMIAPVKVGKEAYVGSGSTINQDVPDGAFAIARARQTTKEGMAKRFIKKKTPQN